MVQTAQKLTENKPEAYSQSEAVSTSEEWTGRLECQVVLSAQVPLCCLMLCVLLAIVRNDQGPTIQKGAEEENNLTVRSEGSWEREHEKNKRYKKG